MSLITGHIFRSEILFPQEITNVAISFNIETGIAVIF